MTPEKRAQIERQIEQLTCFLKSSYAGMAHDVKIVWTFKDGPDAAGYTSPNGFDVVEYWRPTYGKHEEVTIGVGDAYYGSSSLGHMLYEHAYHMRERLQDQLAETTTERTFVDLVKS